MAQCYRMCCPGKVLDVQEFIDRTGRSPFARRLNALHGEAAAGEREWR